MPTSYFIASNRFLCPRIARMDTKAMRQENGDRVGRTNLHECNEFFIYMSCGVVPARHIVLSSPIRGLRPRLPSLRSVLPSRQIAMLCSAFQAHCPRLLLSNVIPVVVKNDMPLPPSLDSWKLVRPTRSPLNCKAKNSC